MTHLVDLNLEQARRAAARQARRDRQRQNLIDAAAHRPLRIVIGASGHFEPGWVPTDVELLNLLLPDAWTQYVNEASVDALLAEHVWEHLSLADGAVAAHTCYRYLTPGGHLRVAVPDGFHPDPAYIDWVKPGGIGPGCEDHDLLYNHQTFAPLFQTAGFEVQLLEYFDQTGTFHCTDWNPLDGKIERSKRFDERNADGRLNYTSLILDAKKL